jgi:hypothetical protein
LPQGIRDPLLNYAVKLTNGGVLHRLLTGGALRAPVDSRHAAQSAFLFASKNIQYFLISYTFAIDDF